jgi:AraC-like DNA-binding protein
MTIMISNSIDSLEAIAKDIREPEDYFNGRVSSYPQSNPNNIIMLYRWAQRKILTNNPGLYHQRYALTLNLATNGLACVNERTIEFKQGEALLIYPFQFHTYMVDMESFSWLVITFESGGLVPVELMNRTIALSNTCYFLAKQMLLAYKETEQNNNPTAKMKLKSYLDCLLLEMLYVAQQSPLDTDAAMHSRKSSLIERINGYIYANFQRVNLSLDEVAEKHSISKGYLCVLYKKLTGQGPGEYIRSLRINRALNLLNSKSYMIADIAEMSGYSSPAIFSRAFRNTVGISPREFTKY